ncbi:MAG: 30S ribosomal protein S18 [Planctomycetes bacterium]|nr:30S ribosomal protein S18 [Planctomycetota bacterium]
MAEKKRSSRTRCRFCRQGVDKVDYKDIDQLRKLTTGEARMFSQKRSGNCARHQRMFKKAIKRARFLALMPYE